MAETHKGFGLLFEMGCGKTLTAIMIAGTAYQIPHSGNSERMDIKIWQKVNQSVSHSG